MLKVFPAFNQVQIETRIEQPDFVAISFVFLVNVLAMLLVSY